MKNINFVEKRCAEETFHEAIWPILVVGQLLGVMPVHGVKGSSVSDLKFKWESLRSLYSFLVAIILSTYTLFFLWKTFSGKADFFDIGKLIGIKN